MLGDHGVPRGKQPSERQNGQVSFSGDNYNFKQQRGSFSNQVRGRGKRGCNDRQTEITTAHGTT